MAMPLFHRKLAIDVVSERIACRLKHVARRRQLTGLICMIVVVSFTPPRTFAQEPPTTPSTALAREAKRFDFDERQLGNYETLPMNWLPITGGSFPRFIEPAFDMETGYEAPPSFRMQIRTGNVGAYYLSKDIPAHPSSEYRVTAWIRTEGLNHAAARISAYYLDHALKPIVETERFSDPVNSISGDGAWTHVIVDLPGGVVNARWIALSCRIEQPAAPNAAEGPFAPIPLRDTNGSAWFDDIAVIRRPRVHMQLNHESHFYYDDQPIRCNIKLLDLDGAGLDLTLKIDDAAGTVQQTFTLDGPSLLADPRPIDISALPPGLYTARLEMRLDEHVIAAHDRRFVVVRRTMAGDRPTGDGFGIILSDESVNRSEVVELVDRIRPGNVKLPLWRYGLTDEQVVFGDADTQRMIETFRSHGIDLVAVLDDLPKSLAENYEYPKRTVERALAIPLTEKRDWVPYLGLLLMRHGAWTTTWQIGDDHGAPRFDTTTIEAAIRSARQVVNPLVGKPRLVLPYSSFGGARIALQPDDVSSTTFEFHQTPDVGIDDVDAATNSDPHGSQWATLSMTDEDRYDREARLVRFARGLISARALGYESVFTPALWTFQESDDGEVIRPREELVILHTMARRLGGLDNATRMTLHPELAAWLFTDAANRSGAIALWWPDEQSKDVTLDVPATTEIHDAWGNPVAVTRSDRGATFRVGGMPVFIGPVSPFRMKGIDSFELDNPVLVASIRPQTSELRLRNYNSDDMVGELHLQGPEGWRVTPHRMTIRLEPGETLRQPIQIKPPSNASTGWYTLNGRLSVGGDGDGATYVSTPVRVDAPGLNVNVFAHRDGDGIRFIQRVTNTADRVMRLRAYLIAPNRPRETRTIDHLGSGETAIREFRVDPATDVEGGFVRLSVEEIGGELKHNSVIQFNEPAAD